MTFNQNKCMQVILFTFYSKNNYITIEFLSSSLFIKFLVDLHHFTVLKTYHLIYIPDININ